MGIPFLRRATLASVLVAAVVLPAAPAAYADTPGSITGHLTTSAGTPAANAYVAVSVDQTWESAGSATTDSNGNYTVTDLPAGSYVVSFYAPDNPEQHYRQKSNIWDADPVAVAAGQATKVDDQLRPTGVITGQIKDTAGNPVPDLSISAHTTDNSDSAWATTDAEGRYRMRAVPGRYIVYFTPIADSYQSQYVPAKLDEAEATSFEVKADEEVTADDTVLPTGHLTGRFTTAAGQPAAGVWVAAVTLGYSYGPMVQTDGNGNFDVAVLAGSYKVSFDNEARTQFYRRKTAFEEADAVIVQGGQSTSISDSWLPTGSVRVKAVDAGTGATIASFCVNDMCTSSSGTVTLTGLPMGRQDLYLYTKEKNYFGADTTVDVPANQTADVTVKLRPGARITTTVVDRATGKGVADVCVNPYRANAPAYLVEGYGDCSDGAGKLTIGPLDAGSYQLFAESFGTPYGKQWVGTSGGTGDQRQAATLVAALRATVAAPQVKLDKAGAVAGRVTDAATGAPLVDAMVTPLSFHPGVGASGYAVTDTNGRYRLDGLGPYEWPLLFQKIGYAEQWSGGATNRYDATRIKVTSGGTATHDTALRLGTEVTGTVKNTAGAPFGSGYILAHNSVTGDIMGSAWMDGGHYSMRALAGQSVYLTYNINDGSRDYNGQWPSAATPRGAVAPAPAKAGVTAVRGNVPGQPGRPGYKPGSFVVPATGQLVIDITVATS
jgi:5-hydroxyisourate hydrolase-like protein (transthyretin family)